MTFFNLKTVDPTPYKKKEYFKKMIWAVVKSTLFRLPMPMRTRWHRNILNLFGAKVRGHVSSRASVWNPWKLESAPLSIVSHGTTIYNLAKVTIGTNCVISQNVYLCAGTHDRSDPAFPLIKDSTAEIHVGDGVWICANAFIYPGVTIGDNCIVAAGSVVTKSVPAGKVVGGNPAKIIGVHPPENSEDHA